jgi:heavy metal translocating P-type ATPase
VPADGLILSGVSDVDESAITGESVPVQKRPGRQVFSGSVNKDGALEIKALRPSRESTYEKIIQLVQQASESRAPVVRLADRYSVWFTAVTFALAIGSWLLAHDPIRLLAVLVVATPCPLILATPIAIISGVSRAASRGIIVKSGGALEKLADVKAFVFDKTGTLTLGRPEVLNVLAFTSAIPSRARDPLKDEAADKKTVLSVAASLDQLSGHILAKSLRIYAAEKNIDLDYPEDFQETFGDGVVGRLHGETYFFGKMQFLKKQGVEFNQDRLAEHEQLQKQGKIAVYLGADKSLLGAVIFADTVRPEIKTLFSEMKTLGLDKIVMLTGDRKNVAEIIAKQVGLNDIHAECLPEDKVNEVLDHKKQFGSVAMVGDGVNDAPALAAADVGIAIGAHNSSASSESSDIVITADDLSRVGTALKISKNTLGIAKQSIFFGIGVSIILMVIAALGHIVPVYGALLQELLDVIVILNALRVNFVKI